MVKSKRRTWRNAISSPSFQDDWGYCDYHNFVVDLPQNYIAYTHNSLKSLNSNLLHPWGLHFFLSM